MPALPVPPQPTPEPGARIRPASLPGQTSSSQRRGKFRLLTAALLLFWSAAFAPAQPLPKITSISPEWIQRGTTVEIVFAGENLGSVTGFVFNGDAGLSATNLPAPAPPKPAVTIESSAGGIAIAEPGSGRDDKRIVAKVTAAADASLTAREARVLTPAGISNPLLLNVGHLPEVRESEPNSAPDQAQTLTLPVALSGSVSTAAQVDHYRFKAGKGQELIFEIDASRRGSPLDSSLAILDASGKELARNEDANALDSLLAFTAPEEGEYVLQLRDFRYQGGANYLYRLYAGALPYLESIFPLGGQRGKQVEIALRGRNLEGMSKMTLSIAPGAPLGRQEIRALTPRGYSNLVPFDVQEHPDFKEAEPNNDGDKANAVKIPVVINGRVNEPKDIDRFKFKSETDQKLVCEVISYRFGSKLDALLVLSDAKGALVQQNDDAAGADARIEFDAKKDAEYVLAIRDLMDRGGENFAYRLSLRPPSATEAGFSAICLPDAFRVSRGSLTRLRCEVARVGGFAGPVRFFFQDLPSGLFGEPLVLSEGATSGLMMVWALAEAPLGTFPVKLRASAMVDGKAVSRTAQPFAERPVRQGYVTVLEQAAFTLTPVTLSVAVEQNQAAAIEVQAQRRAGFTGEIKLAAEGFSAGREPITKSFNVRETTLKGTDSFGKLTLTAKLDSEIGTRSVVIRGEATVDGQVVTQYATPIPVTVAEVPFVISSTLPRLTVTALPTNAQSSASEAFTTIKLQRRAGFTNEVVLALEGLPQGVQVSLDKIPAESAEANLKLLATEKAASGTNKLKVIATGLHNDRYYRQSTGTIPLIISVPELVETNTPTAAAVAPPAAANR